MKHFSYILISIWLCFFMNNYPMEHYSAARCSINYVQPQPKPAYTWLYSIAKDTALLTGAALATQSLAPHASSLLASMAPSFNTFVNNGITFLEPCYEPVAKVTPFVLGALLCYRAYQAQRNPLIHKKEPLSVTISHSLTNNVSRLFHHIANVFHWLNGSYNSNNIINPYFWQQPKSGNSISESTLRFFADSLNTLRELPQQVRTMQQQLTIKTPIVGLYNGGNNCFINAVLQVFNNLDEIVQYFKSDTIATLYKEGTLSSAYKDHLSTIATAQKTQRLFNATIEPAALHTTIREICFNNGFSSSQEDAEEFLTKFLEHLTKNDLNPDQKSAIATLFAVSTQETYQHIETNQFIRQTESSDMLVNLPLLENNKSLDDVLSAYCGDEVVEYLFENGARQVKKHVKFLKTSKIIAFQLKRFGYTNNSSYKISTPISIPLDLTLSPYCVDPQKAANYKLYAVVVHEGSLPNSGHYYTYVKKNEQWYCCNDSRITAVNNITELEKQNFCNSSAVPYLVFYKKID